MHALRWTGIIVFAILAVATLVSAVIALAEDRARIFGWSMVEAGLLGILAVVLWRRPGGKRTGVAFGLWVLASVALYLVLFELHYHGYFG